MLKGIPPILNPELLQVMRAMGHGDELALVDVERHVDERWHRRGAGSIGVGQRLGGENNHEVRTCGARAAVPGVLTLASPAAPGSSTPGASA